MRDLLSLEDCALAEPTPGSQRAYQWMFRILGAYLDERPPSRISLVELPDGFLLRLYPYTDLNGSEQQVVHFQRETLGTQLKQLLQGRKGRSARTFQHRGVWSSFENGHQDLFRSLGYELDEASAQGVLIDELEDGVLLTYRYLDSAASSWKKRMRVLTREDIQTILDDALERREQPVKEFAHQRRRA